MYGANLCRLCNNSNINLLFTINNHSVLKCQQCNFTQIADKLTASETQKIYNNNYFSSTKYKDLEIQKKENLRRISIIRRHFTYENPVVLDAGCSTGDFIALAHSDMEISGIDISPYAVEIAKTKCPEIAHRIWSDNLENHNLPKSHFDAICLWDVIEHLWDPGSTCRQLKESLKSGGYIFISTPNIESSFAKLLGKYWPFMTPPEHMSFFGPKSIKYLFEHILNAKITYISSKGKWANCGFILYKIKRISIE